MRPAEWAPRAVRVAIVDDDTIIRVATLPLLHPQITSVGAFENILELLQARPPADVVLLDLNLTGTGAANPVQGAAAVRRVSRAGYRVLIYTNERRRQVLASCLAAGAQGVIHKAEPVSRLRDAILDVRSGTTVITTALAGLAEVVDRQGNLPSLTPRQREVLCRRARGEPFQQVAGRLGISRKTAEEHMSEVSRKFADFLRNHSAADLERYLGVGPEDLL